MTSERQLLEAKNCLNWNLGADCSWNFTGKFVIAWNRGRNTLEVIRFGKWLTSVAKNLRSDKYQKQHIPEVASIIRYDIHIKSNFDSRKICLKTLSKIEKNANWPNRYSSKWINNAPNRNFVWKKSITKNYLNLS